MKKYFWMVIAIGAMVSGLSVRSAHAEGGDKDSVWHHNFGVNRVAHAQANALSDSVHAHISFVLPVDKDGEITATNNPYGDKPTVYVGGHGVTTARKFYDGKDETGENKYIYLHSNVEIDAGLQFDTGISGYAPGWTALISIDGYYVNPQYWDKDKNRSVAWRGGVVKLKDGTESPWNDGDGKSVSGKGTIDCTLTISITKDGYVKLTVAGATPNLGSFYWNRNPDVNVAKKADPATPSVGIKIMKGSGGNAGITPKYTVGMTRPHPFKHQLDGSTISCTLSSSSLGGMTINQPITGYDAPGNGDPNDGGATSLLNLPLPAWDATWPWTDPTMKAPTSATIVEFPDGDNFKNRHGLDNIGSTSRYSSEKININLRRACRPMGKKIEW